MTRTRRSAKDWAGWVEPLRALDALHLAMALDADAATLVSFDERLREAAKSQGLFIAPSLV